MANGGWILLAAFVLSRWNLFHPVLPFLSAFAYAALGAGMLLAWRFHSSRAFFALLVVLLAQRALAFYSSPHAAPAGPALAALHIIAVLLPINFALLALIEESGFAAPALLPMFTVLFAQAIAVAAGSGMAARRVSPPAVPTYAAAVFVAVAVILALRWLLIAKPLEGALFWALGASFLALHAGGADHEAVLYFSAAALMLGVALVETGYRLAYHDELTGLPSRRAFQDAFRHLEAPYAIAVVDIDHFKKFNDTYGHETGDQVLRLVARRLSRVTGGGKAYRCGGEEFNILFPGRSVPEIATDLEQLRAAIEASSFQLRTSERRTVERGPDSDRRNQSKGRRRTGRAIRQLASASRPGPLSVTVSIGVAGGQKGLEPDAVLRSADHALYRAKANGRNCVETATSMGHRRSKSKTASIA